MESVDIKKLIAEMSNNSTNEINLQAGLTSPKNNELNVDKILEKITKHGIDSLTLEEKKFLDDESKK